MDCDNIKYDISPQILYHLFPPGQCCHHCNTGLATGLLQPINVDKDSLLTQDGKEED